MHLLPAAQAELLTPKMHASCGCGAQPPSRRLFSRLLLASSLGAVLPHTAHASIPECKRSNFTKAISAEQVEQGATQQYRQMLTQAKGQNALAPTDHPQMQRLRFIAERIIPFTPECNERARNWQWEVNLIGARTVNAFCMPGGKIAFYYGILAELQLDDDEVAMIMGHEAAHALLEHAREQMGKNAVTNGALRLGAAIFGLGQVGDIAAQMGSKLLSLKYSRDDETEADRLGLVMAARAGFDPRKGVTLWQKMMGAGGGAPPAMLSTHPAGPARIADIEGKLAQVMPVYQAAGKPGRNFGPPAKLAPAKREDRREEQGR
jgi:predicted Zn-dependent protease